MSWLFSRALVAAFSEENSWDGEPSVQLNVMPTQHKFWRNDKTMEFSNLSRFGLTLHLLTESRGEELLTWYRAGFPVRTFPLPAKAQESQAQGQDSGKSSPGLLARYDPATHSLKTVQLSLLADLEPSSVTLPRWGSMRSGALYQRQMWVPTINAKDCGLLPTPCASDPQLERRMKQGEHYTTSTGSVRRRNADGSSSNLGLAASIQTWPMPASNNATGGATGLAGGAGNRKKLYAMLGETEGKKMGCQTLNPNWVEWLMGWPIGWTDLKLSVMDKYLSALQQHGRC